MISTMFVLGLLVFWLATVLLMRRLGEERSLWVWLLLPFFPVTDIRHNWWPLAPWVFLRAMGLAAIILSFFLYVVQTPWVTDYLSAGQEAEEEVAGSLLSTERVMWRDLRKREHKRAAGLLLDQPFEPVRAEVTGNVVSFPSDNALLPEKELRLVFDKPLAATEAFELSVNPTDLDGPEVQISWKDATTEQFNTRIIPQGYRLRLSWYPLDKHQLVAQIELVLPGEPMSYLVGDMFVYTNKLRYQLGQVDTSYDHEDTLIYLLEQHILQRYPSGLIENMEVLQAKMYPLRGVGQVNLRLTLNNQRMESWYSEFKRTENGWQLEPGALEVTTLVEETSEPETLVVHAKEHLSQRTVEFHELTSFEGEEVSVELKDQKGEFQGVLSAVTERGLLMTQRMGAGSVETFYPEHRVKGIVLASGEYIRVGELDDVPSVLKPNMEDMREDKDETPEGEESSSETVASEYETLVGQWVEVHDVKGRVRRGQLTEVGYNITLMVPMGAGSTAYHYRIEDVEHIVPVSQ